MKHSKRKIEFERFCMNHSRKVLSSLNYFSENPESERDYFEAGYQYDIDRETVRRLSLYRKSRRVRNLAQVKE